MHRKNCRSKDKNYQCIFKSKTGRMIFFDNNTKESF